MTDAVALARQRFTGSGDARGAGDGDLRDNGVAEDVFFRMPAAASDSGVPVKSVIDLHGLMSAHAA